MRNRTYGILALCLVAASLHAQEARLAGSVTDPSGAVIPGAIVVVANVAMGTKSTLTTNADGIYRAPLLSPGIYQVEVTSKGFKKTVRNDVEVRVADRLDINITLEIGASEQQITIVSETPLLNAESASAGTVIADLKRSQDQTGRSTPSIVSKHTK